VVEASQVRLKTNSDDPYTWEKLEEKEHLFSKNLSDLSTGQLKDLCDGVGKSFTAIWKAPIQSEIQGQNGEESVRAARLSSIRYLADCSISVWNFTSRKSALLQELTSYIKTILD